MPIDEAEFITHASRIVERHAGHAGVDPKGADYASMSSSTSSWLLFSLYVCNITFALLDRDEPPSWVQDLFAELGAYVVQNAALESADYYLAAMLKGFYPYSSFVRAGPGLTEARYARLRGYLRVPTDAAEAMILGSFADEEWRQSQSSY